MSKVKGHQDPGYMAPAAPGAKPNSECVFPSPGTAFGRRLPCEMMQR